MREALHRVIIRQKLILLHYRTNDYKETGFQMKPVSSTRLRATMPQTHTELITPFSWFQRLKIMFIVEKEMVVSSEVRIYNNFVVLQTSVQIILSYNRSGQGHLISLKQNDCSICHII